MEALEHEAECLVTERCQLLVVHVFSACAVDFDGSRSRRVEQSHDVEQRGLSTTRRPHDTEEFAFLHFEVHIFQSFHLINSLNVIDNVELPLLYRKMSASERTALAKQVLERVGLSHRMRHMPTQLSGGQCQRVAIARAIVGNPEIILADEPTGNLDSKMGAEVMELLHKLNKEDGRTIVMVTHNEDQAKQTSRTVRFFDGRQVQ